MTYNKNDLCKKCLEILFKKVVLFQHTGDYKKGAETAEHLLEKAAYWCITDFTLETKNLLSYLYLNLGKHELAKKTSNDVMEKIKESNNLFLEMDNLT